MAKKFLIVDNIFLMSACVEFHRDLISKSRKPEKISGGGWWHMDQIDKKMYLYSKSEDFGPAGRTSIVSALENTVLSNRFLGYSFYISSAEKLSDVLLEKEMFDEPDWEFKKE